MALIDDTRWDLDALRAGGSVALVFAVPFSIAATWAADRDDSALALWFSVGAVLGFVLGAGCAAWVQRKDLPLSHGLATTIVTYSLAQSGVHRHQARPGQRRELVRGPVQPVGDGGRRSDRRHARPTAA